ncbi:universal stress protein [Streptomyces minutiscleroticus]|uniref:universal stress protein n=1 Tax=Streptomyces minutiscleroticus TaxID=68238 RepID=UPI00167F1D57|nr:universal stress protein [Streptomyces minutiscleroticus]
MSRGGLLPIRGRRASCTPFPALEEDRADREDHEVRLLADALRPWREKYPTVPVLEDVVLLDPAEALIRRTGSSSLVVMGQPSRRADTVVEALLREVRCPVAVVPPSAG